MLKKPNCQQLEVKVDIYSQLEITSQRYPNYSISPKEKRAQFALPYD